MEQHGFIQDMLDVKVLILFVMAKLSYPVTLQTIYELCYQDDKLSYFDVSVAVPQMVQSGHLQQLPDDTYVITDKGREHEEITCDAIAYPVMQRALMAVQRYNTRIQRKGLIETKIEQEETGDYLAQLCLRDDAGVLMKLELAAPTLSQARTLVCAYEKQADRLAKELQGSEQGAQEAQPDLEEGSWGMVQEEMRGYRSYLDADGARRQEVKKTEETAQGNEEVVAEAVRKGKEIQDYIDDWEPDDEDDELDEEALWAPVLTITAGFQKDGRFRAPAVRDKKKMNVLEAVSRLSGTDLLSLCVPAGTVISENWISTAAFPSALYAGGESGKRGTTGDVWTAGLERALLDAYAAHFFTRFGQEKTGSIHYEQEYLLQGNASERENLKRTVNELLAVREAVNLAALYADSEKRSEAEALALAITGLAGITPITAAASFFIMTVWAFADVADVKVLLAGGKIPFFKQPGEWQISLSALTEKGASIFLETGTDPSLKNGTDDRGLDYQDWLKLFFLIQGKSRFCYRMMDMIQNRISEKEPGFRMDQCQYGVSVSYAAQGTLIPLRRTSQKEY